MLVAAIAFFFLRKSSSVSDDGMDTEATEGSTKSSLSVPEFPSVSLEQIWSQCHAACDSSRDFVEKFVGSASEEAADAAPESEEL